MAAVPASSPQVRSVTELTLALEGLVSDAFDDVLPVSAPAGVSGLWMNSTALCPNLILGFG